MTTFATELLRSAEARPEAPRDAALAVEIALAGRPTWLRLAQHFLATNTDLVCQQMEVLLDSLDLAGLLRGDQATLSRFREELRAVRNATSVWADDAILPSLVLPWGQGWFASLVNWFATRETERSSEWRCVQQLSHWLAIDRAAVENTLKVVVADDSANDTVDREVERLTQLGLQDYLRGDYREAARHWTATLKLRPRDARLFTQRGDAHRLNCEHERALADYDTALRLEPNLASALLGRALVQHYRGEHERAVNDCTAILEATPANLTVLKTRAAAFAALQQHERALADLSIVLQQDGDDEQALHQRGLIHLETQQSSRAIADFDRLLHRNPHHVPTYLQRGHAHRLRSDYLAAIRDYGEVLRYHADNVQAYSGRALTYRLRGELERAIADYGEALQRDPKNARLYGSRGALHRARGEWERAEADLDESVRLDPKNWKALYHRAKVHLARRRWTDAASDLDASLQRNPSLALAYLSRALLHDRAGRWEAGVADCDRALELERESAHGFLVRGMVNSHRGDFDAALADLTHAIRLDARCGPAYQERCLVYSVRGKNDRALDDCNRLLSLEPGNAWAYQRRATLHHRAANQRQAWHDYGRALQLDPLLSLRGALPSLVEAARDQRTLALADLIDGVRQEKPAVVSAKVAQPRPRPAVASTGVETLELPAGHTAKLVAGPNLVKVSAALPVKPRPIPANLVLAPETVEEEMAEVLLQETEEPTPGMVLTEEATAASATETSAVVATEQRPVAVPPPSKPSPAPTVPTKPKTPPKRAWRKARQRSDDEESWLERYRKPGLATAGLAAAALLLYFWFPLSLFGSWSRPRLFAAHGTVLFDEQPLAQANIVLEPTWTPNVIFPRPHAIAGDDGTFVLSTFGKADGAPAGDYKVMVTWFNKAEQSAEEGAPPPKNYLPTKYGKFETSGLVIHIQENDNALPPLKLAH